MNAKMMCVLVSATALLFGCSGNKNANKEVAEVQQEEVQTVVRNQLTEQEKADGWKLLFDGKTTQGWRGAHLDAFPTKGWHIADGMLVVEASDGGESTNGGDIVTDGQYSAFELSVDFKITTGANSGIKYFVTEGEKQKGSAYGLEFQILDDAVHPGRAEHISLIVPAALEKRAKIPATAIAASSMTASFCFIFYLLNLRRA